MRAAGDVGEGLVDRDPLYEWREVVEDGNSRIAETLILAEIPTDEDEVRAELACFPSRHTAFDPEGLGLIAGGKHYTAADSDRLTAEVGVQQLFDRGIERIEVGMEDVRLGRHHRKSRVFIWIGSTLRVGSTMSRGRKPLGRLRGSIPGPP